MSQLPDFYPTGASRSGRHLFTKAPRLLSLDFDGTLAEIALTPGQAHLTEKIRMALWGLVRLPETQLIISSGRALPDLKRKVRLPGLVYVGNHGMDISPPSAGWGIPALKAWTWQTQQVQKRLEPLLAHWPGSFLEMKGPDLSLHYRRLRPRQVKEIIPAAIQAVQELPILSRKGKCVLEFKPVDSPNKGLALERLACRFFRNKPAGLCLHIGDDATDEDAFRALRRMKGKTLGLKVGSGPSRAHYRLKNCAEVLQFLREFLK